jgi:hypothetical protein
VRSTHEEHLPEDRAPWRHRDRGYWENRADQIAPEVGAYVREVLDSDDVLSLVRVVQSMVTHLEKFPVERAVATCTRARHFGSYQYATIKNILHRGLDLVPSHQSRWQRACRAALRPHDRRDLPSQRVTP